jgi:hypothetical protein
MASSSRFLCSTHVGHCPSIFYPQESRSSIPPLLVSRRRGHHRARFGRAHVQAMHWLTWAGRTPPMGRVRWVLAHLATVALSCDEAHVNSIVCQFLFKLF